MKTTGILLFQLSFAVIDEYKLLVGGGNRKASPEHAQEVTDPSSHACSWAGWDVGHPEYRRIQLRADLLRSALPIPRFVSQ